MKGSKSRQARRVITEHERLRRRAGYTVTQFAREVGFSYPIVSSIEGGKLKPSARYRAAASRVLGVPEEMIFGEERDI